MTAQHLIDVATLATLLNESTTRVIDCRFDLADSEAGYRQFLQGHIPGAVFADLEKNLSSPVTASSGRHPLPDVDKLVGFFSQCGLDSDSHVVVYDGSNGAMAARCWWLLRWLGHPKVQLLDGGYAAWCAAGQSTFEGAVTPSAGDFRPVVDRGAVLTTAEVLQALPNMQQFRLLDARDAARFAGKKEPIDAVAGHVPGSINQPLSESLAANGHWKSQAELTELWQRVLGDDRERAWAVMCGSGVTACHLALSAMQAGYVRPRLYAGSWSEWIRDPSRPIGGVRT